MKKKFENYFQAVRYLESINRLPQPDYLITKKGRGIFIKRMQYLSHRLGDPQKKLKCIHVAGTSGKGSVVNMLRSVLTQAGYKVGQYTSPYPTTTIEKYQIGDQLIDPNDFARLVNQVQPAVDQCYLNSPYGRPSYFEICTAIAFLYFVEQKVDYAILEVGLGGRLDATNIIPTPKVTIINKIGLDHVDLLGNSLTKIAAEKAGIIKPKAMVFVNGVNHPKVLNVFKKYCQKNKAILNIVPPKFKQDYQSENTAIVTAVALYLAVKLNQIQPGLKKTRMSCRFEIIQKNPMVILDGAHNESKMATVVKNLENLTYKKLYLIIALTNERSPSQVFKKIKDQADYLYITRYPWGPHRAYPPLKLAKKLKLPLKSKKVKIFLDPFMALGLALRSAKKQDLILITGSFYLAGELRKYWRSEIKILEQRKI
ncbi:MAG: hypothetical protein A3A24_00735 [Candidatus Buchananbacteria bacterium RIFCSPLOWO2_01_FULL_46_12]|uniref:tetrahydrofolate synthase n=2 Tax=Candidatus Buchananiibacteriota TaxID=1817903 RepID=A0A1G1YUE5_9BACT|nr:MAG: hypothetical protein A2744_02520 [Candidatus Buchananbacteria bacterium RIFCSPHIGHO2_01_FULL_44_11]OGY55027.1 MAG: hypothetical protein A3A24_00735 [Candidatus Buchananbacteria bacterium RIFCSPLOWO2_01_FULL_46_12]